MQHICFATSLKSHFSMGVFLQICCIFSKHLFLWTPLDGCLGSPPEVFLEKGVLKICRKFTREHPYQSAISINLQSNFVEITLQHGCSPANLLHISRAPFPVNTSEGLLLNIYVTLRNVILKINNDIINELEPLFK